MRIRTDIWKFSRSSSGSGNGFTVPAEGSLFFQEAWKGYLLALVSTGIAFSLKSLLSPVLGPEAPFLLFFSAVLLSALFGGVGPGVLALVISATAANYFFLEPFGFRLAPNNAKKLVVFVLESSVFILVAYTVRQSRASLRTLNVSLQKELGNRRVAEKALVDSEELYRSLIEQASDGIFLTNLEGTSFIGVNERACEMLGYTEDELLTLGPKDIISEASLKNRPWMDGNLHDRRILRIEREYRRKDGSTIPIEVTLRVIRDDLIQGIFRDLSERRKTEERIRTLSRAVEQNPTSIVITDAQGRIEYVNPRFIELTGYTLDEAIGQRPSILKSGLTAPEVYRDLWASISGGRMWHGELINKKKNGDLYWESVSISPIVNDAGTTTHYVAVKENITDRRHVEEELVKTLNRAEEGQRMLDALMEYVPEGITIATAPEMNITMMSKYGLGLIGAAGSTMSLDEVNRQRTVFYPDGVTPISREELPLVRAVREGETINDFEMVDIDAEGKALWYLCNAAPIRDNNGAIRGGIVTWRDNTERKRMEEDLVRHKEQLSILLESISDIFFAVDREWRFTYLNNMAVRISGFEENDLIGRSLWECYPELLGTDLERAYRKAMQSREPVQLEHENTAGNAWFETSVYPTLTGLSIYSRDVSERKKAEAAVRASEERFSKVFQLSPLALILSRFSDGVVVDVNDNWVQMVGYRREELIGNAATEMGIWSPEDRARAIEILETEGRLVNFHQKLRVRGGEIREVLISSDVIELSDGQHLITIAVDITEQKQAERVLAQQAEMLRLANDAILVWPPDGPIEYWNNGAEALYGFTFDEVRDHVPYQVLGTEFPESYQLVLSQLKEAGYWEGELRHRAKDGRRLVVSSRMQLLARAGADPLVVEINRDITDRTLAEIELREAKERAEDANRMKSVFLANMSHEIRTPLTAILGFADVLARQLSDHQRQFADRISQSSKRLSETLESVLTLARLEADRVELNPQVLNLASEVREVVSIYRAEAAKKGLEMRLEIPPEFREIHTLIDRGGFTSALQNLIGNAIKYTPQGCITVGIELERSSGVSGLQSDQVKITVADTGIGISPEFLPHLFEPFSQESIGMARRYQGSGLGLSITKQLVEKMGGAISVESEKDAGSRFSIRFPVTQHRPEQGGRGDGAVHPPDMSRCRVLIVEDDESSRYLMEEVLQEEVGEVVSAPNALQAVSEARLAVERNRPFDLMLLDINLGAGIDGVDLMKQLRAIPSYHAIPIVAITAYALPGDRERFLSGGFDAYLRKPFTVEELTGLVTECLT